MPSNKLSELLANVDSHILATYLSQEHVQTISVVISCLTLNRQSEVVRLLPTSIQPEVTTRMAQLGHVDPLMFDAIAEVIRTTLLGRYKG